MSNVYDYLWLIPVLPALGAVIIALFGPRFLKNQSHWPCVLAAGASALLSFGVFSAVNSEDPPPTSHNYGTWFRVSPFTEAEEPKAEPRRDVEVAVDFSLRADALSAIMLVTVTFISTLIAIFAIGYMHGDPGYPRFFAEVSLFVAAMTLLVSGNNFLLLFAGWEGVGVCSYLLIGFWFTKPSAAAAARKAFLVNRIGDFGFILGILLLWVSSGYYLDYDNVFRVLPDDPAITTLVCLLLFCGAAGKSAQVPLHVWLPDAMEGPTPVSALIHAATMVTAGVYMVARCTPLFQVAPEAQLLVAGIGGFTALFAALIALTQNDLKRVLAYSTLSQLGYMFLALGCAVGPKGGADLEHSLVTFAVIAAIFHLFTHAFFKALLFLSAGSVMHAMGGIDMRRFGGLRKVMPITNVTFGVGALTLAGCPLLSAFWSKDEILAAALGASQQSASYGAIYFLLFGAGVLTAGLTAFYTFRAYFMTFWGELKLPPEAGQHGHSSHDTAHGHDHAHGHAPAETHAHGPVDESKLESPPVMTVPLIILAVFALGIGLVVGPTELFAHFLEKLHKTSGFPEATEHGMNFGVMGLGTLFALAGIGVAWLMYVKQPELPGKLAASIQGLYQVSLNKFFIDEIYDQMVARVQGFAEFCRTVDQEVVDGLVDLTGEVPRLAGSLFRPVQNGLLQFYALAMMLGLTVFLIALARSL
ncbi:MAG: NADH-quinone oxidoreductase subunit L [Planctomycetes bacterium]|nr:NADH-quinone oxidoreductase subunit L [Planctomycetota bacterium]